MSLAQIVQRTQLAAVHTLQHSLASMRQQQGTAHQAEQDLASQQPSTPRSKRQYLELMVQERGTAGAS